MLFNKVSNYIFSEIGFKNTLFFCYINNVKGEILSVIISVRTCLWLLILSILAFATVAYSQDNLDSTQSEPWFTISGTASATVDMYDFTSDPTGSQRGRRPSSLTRLLFSPTLKFGSYFSLPLNLMFTFPETNTTTPRISSPTVSQYLQNPANAFGMSSFSPKLGWAQFHLGSHAPQFSDLSVGDQQIFGGGIDIKPGLFRFAASAGVAQRAVSSDYINGIQGAYRKDMYMARLSYGSEDSTNIGFNVVYSKDDKSSIRNNIISITPSRYVDSDSIAIVPADTVRIRAEEGMIGSLNAKILIAKGLEFKMEGALSNFTRDLNSAEQEIAGNPLSSITTTRTSTRTDFAGNAELLFRMKTWGLKLSGLYMGAGFVAIGYPFQQSDRFDLKASPYLRLFDGDLSINGSIGNRVNNLSGTKGETLSQFIASANVNANITEEFSISGSFSNFGVRNDNKNDTLKIQNVSSSFSIDPSLVLASESLTHIINASFSLDQFDDFNVISGEQSSNDTRTFMTYYNLTLNKEGLNFGVNGSYMENDLPTGMIIIRSLGINASYLLFEKSLIPTISYTIGSSTLSDNPTDTQNFLKAGIRWIATKWLSLAVSYGGNNYEYGNPLPRGNAFNERLFQFSVTSNF